MSQSPSEVHGSDAVARFEEPLTNLTVARRRRLKLEEVTSILQAFDIIWIGGRTGLYRHPDAIFSLVPKFEADVRERADVEHAPQCTAHSPLRQEHQGMHFKDRCKDSAKLGILQRAEFIFVLLVHAAADFLE
eukprot:CAMPEP_0181413318 /NCGR_PEP_ID=MMETSP1110-20121109/8908_1 /TAXON_ID=174948 /ORGANISM="Symbiodinium sp., Strain CCMP421" /LENGTH=132 /DNA_ID=CAMNT_0023536123 /DNA_START=363 /DNA_END=762 /DNA_ORIENTATION=-